jgi:hypothetical protein
LWPSSFGAKYGGKAGLSVAIVCFPGAMRVRFAAAQTSGVALGAADGATVGAVVTTAAADGDDTTGVALDPLLEQADAKMATSPMDRIRNVRTWSTSGGRQRARVYR